MPEGMPVAPFAPQFSSPCLCRSGKAFGDCCGSRAENREPPVGVHVWPGFLPRDECRKWVSRLERQPRLRATITANQRSASGALAFIEDPSRVCHDVKPGVLRKRVNDQLAAGFQKAAALAGNQLAWFETPRILRYQSGGFYLRHSDSCQWDAASRSWFKVHDRDLSLLLYLNDDFKGGGLSFTHFNYRFQPKAGDLLVFPSDNRFEHQAEKVESGFRYVVASWAAFAGTPKVNRSPPKGVIKF